MFWQAPSLQSTRLRCQIVLVGATATTLVFAALFVGEASGEATVRLPPVTDAPLLSTSHQVQPVEPDDALVPYEDQNWESLDRSPWTLQWMPDGLIYRSYMAGVKEPRFASVWSSEKDAGSVWDAALGGRLGILRYGTSDCVYPQGWQLDLEGGVFARLDPQGHSTPLIATDFRVGMPPKRFTAAPHLSYRSCKRTTT